jgi:hypothetical protein
MALSENEINKVNNIYNQVDTLTAENKVLKDNIHDHSDLLAKLDSIESKLDTLLSKGTGK